MNIVESFANWMEENSVATLGQNLFISRAREKPKALYWLVPTGGLPAVKNVNNGVLVSHNISVFYRDTDAELVYDRLSDLQDLILTDGCIELEDHQVVDITTDSAMTDRDLDDQERTVGLLQITITTYKE